MAVKPRKVVVFLAPVTVQDALVSAAGAEQARLPSDAADTALVAKHASDLRLATHVPFLQLARRGADREIVTVKRPADGGDLALLAEIVKLGDF